MKRVQHPGRSLRGKHFERMRLKGKNNAGTPDLPGSFDHFSEYRLMPQMHSIEVPQRQNRIQKPLAKVFKAAYNSHGAGIIAQQNKIVNLPLLKPSKYRW
jgi:hypothetical protein